MPTPAPHVPINLLKAGGTAFFSAACVAALAKCGYSPADFGTYDGVRSSITDAQKQVSDLQAAGQPVPPELQQRANSQSGHIGMNTLRQRQRGNPCSNVVDGYYANQAACMPHEGGAFGQDGRPRMDTEHGRYTAEELASPDRRGLTRENPPTYSPATGRIEPNGTAGASPTGSSVYPAGQMREDERARIRSLLERRAEEQQRRTEASGQGAGQGGAAPGPAAGTGPASGAQGGAVGASDGAPSMAKTVDEAADCVMQFKDAMETAMRRKCVADEERNRSVANGGPNKTPAEGAQHRQNLRNNVDAAQARLEQSEAAMRSQRSTLSAATTRANRAGENWRNAEAAHAANPTPATEAARQQAAAAAMDAQANQRTQRRALDWQMAEVDAAEGARSEARRASSAAENAHCLAEQARAIGNPPTGGRTDGRAPSRRTDDNAGDTTTQGDDM
jgi:hypothetical protein